MRRAKIITTDVPFPSDAWLVAPVGMASDVRYMFAQEFKCEKKPDSATMFLCGSDCFDIVINREDVASYSVRSYAYCCAYEVYDVAEFLKEGTNEIIVKYIDGVYPTFRGFICELIVDGERKLNPFWYYDRDRGRTFVSRYINRGGAEIYDERRILKARLIQYGDTYTQMVPLADWPGRPLFYQSRQREQQVHEIYPESARIDGCIAAREGKLWTFDFKFGAVLFAEFSGEKLKLTNVAGIYSFYIDGKKIASNSEADIPAGNHIFAAFVRGGMCSFEAVGAELSDFKAFHLEPEPRRYVYPWNENIQTYKIPDEVEKIIAGAAKSGNIPSDAEEFFSTESLWHEILSQKIDESSKADLPWFSNGKIFTLPASPERRVITVDFGLERVGFLKVRFETAPPAEVDFFTYELITADGPRKMNEKSCGKIIQSDKRCEFTSARLRGFRYATFVLPKNVWLNYFTVSVLETKYGTTDVGAFSSSDEKLDAIYKMSTDTAAVCMLDSYVDCPGYEQNIWVGDAGVTGKINALCFGEREFDARYIDLIAQSMAAGLRTYYRGSNPLYVNDTYLPCACFTTYPDGGIPIWSFTWVLHTLDHFKYYGFDDKTDERLAAVEECLRRAEAHFSERGLFAPCGAWNLIEWANNDLSPYGEVSANNMMLFGCYTNVSNVFRERGNAKKADEYSKKANRLKEAINKYCWSDARCAYVDTVRDEDGYALYLEFCKFKDREPKDYETYLSASRVSVQTATFAILFDVADGERKDACEKILLDDIARGNYRAGTPAKRTFGEPSENEAPGGIVRIGTPFFMYYALGALFKLGRYDEATGAIRREWGAMLDDGLTTCVETFKNADGEWGRSIAHAWSAAPAVYLKTEILGVKPVSAGYEKFTVEPHPCGLTHAEGAVPTPYGNICVKWTVKRGKIKIKVDAPKECKRI